MVRVLIAMRTAAQRNARRTRFGVVAAIVAIVLGLLIAGLSALVGWGAGPPHGMAAEIALVILSWVLGRLGFAAFAGGDPAVPVDLFRIVAVPRRTLARGLLGLAMADVTLILPLIAFSSLAAFGFRHGLLAGLIGVIGAAELLLLTVLGNLIVGTVVPAGSRRRRDVGAVLSAVVISLVVIGGPAITAALSVLRAGGLRGLRVVVCVLPTGWAADAVAEAVIGRPLASFGLLVALAAVCAGLLWCWPRLLRSRLASDAASGHHVRSWSRRWRVPSTPAGAVFGRELRLWIRDPNRVAFLVLTFIVSLGVCLVPLFSRQTLLLLPFVGLGTILLGAAVAGNSLGFDGRSFALSLGVAGSARAEIRGRQAAWLVIIGPFAVLASIAGLLISGESVFWPWVLTLLPSLLGSGLGIVPAMSVSTVQPLDDNGTPGPTWVIKIYATLLLTAACTLPAVAVLVAGSVLSMPRLRWFAVAVGVATGIVLTVALTRYAETKLRRTGPEIFQVLADAPSGRL